MENGVESSAAVDAVAGFRTITSAAPVVVVAGIVAVNEVVAVAVVGMG